MVFRRKEDYLRTEGDFWKRKRWLRTGNWLLKGKKRFSEWKVDFKREVIVLRLISDTTITR